jgi:glucose 1-dehydrogenase
MNRLTGKTALVTGASRGIGRGIALSLAEEGADIVVNFRANGEEADATAEEIRRLGRRALVWQADVSDRSAVDEMIAGAVEEFGRLDIVVANAARSRRGHVVELEWDQILGIFDVCLFGVFHTCQLGARQMISQAEAGRGGGKIIVIGSVHSEIPVPGAAAYNMSKIAINHMARTMAVELAPYCINVNAINPGWIDTPGERSTFGDEMVDAGGERMVWGRVGCPEDIGKAAAYLASDDADYVTGSSLRVDGGFVLGLRLPDK